VKGNVPEIVPTVPAAAAEPKEICALLIFSNIDEGAAPLSVQLTAEGDCTSGTPRFDWDFGDGSPGATGETVVHTFEKAGTYTVKGKVTSDEIPGMEDVDEVDIVVTAPPG
jgi:PKD repeat protein